MGNNKPPGVELFPFLRLFYLPVYKLPSFIMLFRYRIRVSLKMAPVVANFHTLKIIKEGRDGFAKKNVCWGWGGVLVKMNRNGKVEGVGQKVPNLSKHTT